MIRIDSLDNLAPGGSSSFKRRSIDIPKGKKVMAYRAKVTYTLNNATGGNTTLSDAEKQVLLAMVSWTLAQGKDEVKPFDNIDGKRMRDIARFCTGVELRGYSDSTTGLAKTIASGAGQTVVCDMVIPTGRLWFLNERDQRLFGAGRTQAKNHRLGVELSSSATVKTNVTLTGLQVVLLADLEPCKGDPVGAIPFYRQFDETSEDVRVATPGLPLLVIERTAAHASTSLTAISLWVDDEVIHRNVSPSDTIADYNQAALANSAGSLVDRHTVLYAVAPSSMGQLADLPTGQVRFKQDTKNLATAALAMLWLPITKPEDVERELAEANEVRVKDLKAVGVAQHRGENVPPRIAAVLGAGVLVDRDDKEFEQLPGMRKLPGKPEVLLDVPAGLAARAKASMGLYEGAGDKKAAGDVAKSLAAAVPGGVPSARGFAAGASKALDRIAGFLG